MQTINIVTLAIFNSDNELLLVRKKGSSYYQLPGGKAEAEELHIATLRREIQEELALSIQDWDIHYLGEHSSIAVNEQKTEVVGQMYAVKLKSPIQPKVSNEIEAYIWVNGANYLKVKWANLVAEFIFPLWSIPKP